MNAYVCEGAVVAVIKCPIMSIMELKFFHRKHLRSYEWQTCEVQRRIEFSLRMDICAVDEKNGAQIRLPLTLKKE